MLHGILDGGSVGSQAGGQSRDQHIGLVEILGFIQRVRILVPVLAICQAQSRQEVSAFGLIHSVQSFHVAVDCFGFFILENVSYLHIGKLDALNGISVAGFTVTQSGRSITSQNVVYPGFVINAGRHIAGIPNAVLLGVGKVIFVDGQGAGFRFVDGRHIGQLHSGSSHREGQEQGQSQNQGKNLCNGFHKIKHFLSLM